MKKLLFSLLILSTLCARPATMQWTLQDHVAGALTVRKIYQEPIYYVGVFGTNFVTGDRRTITNGTPGVSWNTNTLTIIVTNLYAGALRTIIPGPYKETILTNTVPDTNGFVLATDYTGVATNLPQYSFAYSQAVSDSRYIRTNLIKNYIYPGSNVTFVTNANGTVTVSSTGGSSGSATNVFFIAGQSTTPRTIGGSNAVDVTGTLTNSTTGNAATATSATTATTALTMTNTVARQEYFYTNTANMYRSNQFTFTGGGMNGQTGYAPGASYANNVYIWDLLNGVMGNPEYLPNATLTNFIALFATNQTAHSQTPGGVAQNGSLQTGGASYHPGFSLIELAYIHYKRSGQIFAYTNFQNQLSNAMAYVIKSNNIPSSFGTNGNYWDGWGPAEFGYNSYSCATYKYSCDLLAEMATAAGQYNNASNWLWQGSMAKAGMTNLWDETRGLFKTCLYGDAAETHSLVANALAVLYDAADSRMLNRVEEEFVKYSGHNAGFFQHGAMRTTPVGECLGASIDPDCDNTDASGTYQTGGYWPLTWGIEVVKRRRPDIAEDMAKQLHTFMSATNKFYEWWNVNADLGITAVNKGSSNYLMSAGVPATYGLTVVPVPTSIRHATIATYVDGIGITNGNVTIPGTLGVTGATTMGTLVGTTISGNGSGLSNAVDIIAGDGSVTIVTNANKRSFTITAAGGGGGWTGNPNQFTGGSTTNIKSGVLLTNAVNYIDDETAFLRDANAYELMSYDSDNDDMRVNAGLLWTGQARGDGRNITNLNAAYISGDLSVSNLTAVTLTADTFNGNGSGLTNPPYAVFSETWASNTANRVVAAAAWTNIIFTTNATQNFDNTSAFTLSNSFLIVNSAGAGRWRIRGHAVLRSATSGNNAISIRLRRHNNTAATLLTGDNVFMTYYSAGSPRVVGVVTLVAGDILGMQVYGQLATDVGLSADFDSNWSAAALEFERQ